MKGNKVIYQLIVDDIQTVTNEILERDLTDKEILEIEDKIADRIDWYGAIESAIEEHIPEVDDGF